jgi:hypothetical protein
MPTAVTEDARVYSIEAMITRRRRISRTGLVLASMFALTACGGTSITRSVSPPTSTGDDFGADVPVRLTAAGVKPSTLHLFNGLQATLVNEDTVVRSLSIDAARSDQPGCAALTIVLQPGERRATDVLPRFAACYFRDAQRPAEPAFQGIVVTH